MAWELRCTKAGAEVVSMTIFEYLTWMSLMLLPLFVILLVTWER